MNTKLIEKIDALLDKLLSGYLRHYPAVGSEKQIALEEIKVILSSYKSQIIKEVIESLPKKKETRNREDIYAICNTCGKSAENMAGFPECSCMGFNEAIDQIKNKLELLVKK